MLGPLDIDCIRLRSVGQRRGRCQSAVGPESSERLCGTDAPRLQRFVRAGSYWIPAGGTEVQDALCGSLARISTLRSAHAAALRCYLRRAVENRIDDYRRRALFRLNHVAPSSEPLRLSDEAAPQLAAKIATTSSST